MAQFQPSEMCACAWACEGEGCLKPPRGDVHNEASEKAPRSMWTSSSGVKLDLHQSFGKLGHMRNICGVTLLVAERADDGKSWWPPIESLDAVGLFWVTHFISFQNNISKGLNTATDKLVKNLKIQDVFTNGNNALMILEDFGNNSTKVTDEIKSVKAGITTVTTKMDTSKNLFTNAFNGITNCENQDNCRNLKVNDSIHLLDSGVIRFHSRERIP